MAIDTQSIADLSAIAMAVSAGILLAMAICAGVIDGTQPDSRSVPNDNRILLDVCVFVWLVCLAVRWFIFYL